MPGRLCFHGSRNSLLLRLRPVYERILVMAILTCPQCGQLTSTGRSYCIHCDFRLPHDFGVLLQPDPKADMDATLRATLLRDGTQAAIRQWLEINPLGTRPEAKAHVVRLQAALAQNRRGPAG